MRRTGRVVLGFHGCDASVAAAVIERGAEMVKSEKSYDWLGPGVYFWENDALRAWEWARDRCAADTAKSPAVVGALIDLGSCLDLTLRDSLSFLKIAYEDLERDCEESGLPLPENKATRHAKEDDKLLRYLDCAVIRRAHTLWEKSGFTPFDTVRGLFQEGEPIYPGAKFMERSHTQISVLNPGCIIEVFSPKELRHLRGKAACAK